MEDVLNQIAADVAVDIDRQIMDDVLYPPLMDIDPFALIGVQRIESPRGTIFKLEIVSANEPQVDPFDAARVVLGDFS